MKTSRRWNRISGSGRRLIERVVVGTPADLRREMAAAGELVKLGEILRADFERRGSAV
ncbi:MAG TPA: hypothetical protein VGA56_10340 [Opitutaceae bacterium]